MGQWAEKWQGRESTKIRQENKKEDSNAESNDNPVIPDWGETSDIPGHPSGDKGNKKR